MMSVAVFATSSITSDDKGCSFQRCQDLASVGKRIARAPSEWFLGVRMPSCAFLRVRYP